LDTIILTYPEGVAGDISIEGKFLQLHLTGRDYLLFAVASEHRYHNQLLARFLSEQALRHHWADKQNLIVDHPGLVVAGGGRFRLDPARKSLRVWDESSVYGRFDPSQLAAQLSIAEPPWDKLALGVD